MRTDASWFPLGADTSFLGSGSGYLRRGSPRRPSQALGAAPQCYKFLTAANLGRTAKYGNHWVSASQILARPQRAGEC